MQAFAIHLEGSRAIYGDKDMSRKLPPNTTLLLGAADREAAGKLVDAMLGPLISSRGGFSMEADAPSSWLHPVSFEYRAFGREALEIVWASRRLGSIEMTGFALTYSDDELAGFWIEAKEGGKSRTLSADKVDGIFEGMPPGFKLTTAWIATTISTQF